MSSNQQKTHPVTVKNLHTGLGQEEKLPAAVRIDPPMGFTRQISGRSVRTIEAASADLRNSIEGGHIRPGWESWTLFTFGRYTPGTRWTDTFEVSGSKSFSPTLAAMAVGFTGLPCAYDRGGLISAHSSQALTVLAPVNFERKGARFRTAIPFEDLHHFPQREVRDLTLAASSREDLLKATPWRFHSVIESSWAFTAHVLIRQLLTVLKKTDGRPTEYPSVCGADAIRAPVPSLVVEKEDGTGESLIPWTDSAVPEEVMLSGDTFAAAIDAGRVVHDFSSVSQCYEMRSKGMAATLVPETTHWFIVSGNIRNVNYAIGDFYLHWAV